jgi:hypothetical protein
MKKCLSNCKNVVASLMRFVGCVMRFHIFSVLFCYYLCNGQMWIALDDPSIDGEMSQACDSANAELLHEISAMFFDGFDADAEIRGSLFVKLAFGDELQHLNFTGGQLLDLLPGREVSLEIVMGMGNVFFHNDALILRMQSGHQTVLLPWIIRTRIRMMATNKRT